MPYATYPQTPQIAPPPSRHSILVPLQSVAQYLPPHPFGAALGYHQQCRPASPPWYMYYYAQAPWWPPCPDPYRRWPLPECRALPWTDQDTRSPYTVDPILATPSSPSGTIRLQWDLADNPMRIVLDCRPENRWIQRAHLARAAVCEGTRKLERLVLVFAGLARERDMQIEATHAHPATLIGAVDEDVSWVTVHDVFFAMFQWLTSPIGADEMRRLEGERFDTVVRAEARRTGTAGREGTKQYRKIDYLGERRGFKGMRPARRDEVPDGRTLGEVFVVELGRGG
ncbi:hypothetical protein V8D89_002826 [Ganoderma adspersum]